MTLECIRSVYRETKAIEFEIIVLDNASIDGSVEAIKTEFGGKIKFIISKKNYCFASGNNLAVKEAIGEYLLLLNPDTSVFLDVETWNESALKVWIKVGFVACGTYPSIKN